MKPETDPITDDEWLLRRVHIDKFRTEKVPIISPDAFSPREVGKSRDPDLDGISLYRAACLADPTEALTAVAPEKRDQQGIVRIQVAFLKSLGLTARSMPDRKAIGHVVIPELNADAQTTDKQRLTPLKLRLAVEASRDENIVRWPATR